MNSRATRETEQNEQNQSMQESKKLCASKQLLGF
jgi:hypothetical protein